MTTPNTPFELSDEIIDKLLDKLSSDEDFRAMFQKSPRAALASLGHEPAAKASDNDEGAWSFMKCTKLADAGVIKDSRDELRKQLLSNRTKYDPIKLQA